MAIILNDWIEMMQRQIGVAEKILSTASEPEKDHWTKVVADLKKELELGKGGKLNFGDMSKV